MADERATRRNLLKELFSNGPGRIGLILLALLSITAIIVAVTYPRDFGSARWGNPAYWADNPRSVPPSWMNVFTRTRLFRHHRFSETTATTETAGARAFVRTYDFPVEFTADEPPNFISISMREFVFGARPPIILGRLIRPDETDILLFRDVVAGPRPGDTSPYTRHGEEPLRFVLNGDGTAGESLAAVYEATYDTILTPERRRDTFEALLFGRAEDDVVRPLHGSYILRIEVTTVAEDDTVAEITSVFGGSVFGAMGTDALGRDLAIGLLFGLPVALVIGLSTSTVSTFIGTSLGLVSGYVGGRTDTVIQRAADIVANIPVLPLLIFLVFIGGSQLWIILLVLVAFSWPGLTIMVRTMVLQLKSGQEVEAAVSLGASKARIIVRHVFPHTASYIFAQLVFFAPSAVLAEAGLSFLGLGDPSIPTWGQILEHGFRTGAVFLGYWWWVIPPGLLIVLTAVTFMFIALGMEPVIDPRLKGARSWRS